MGTVISNLKARFGIDTSDFKKGLKDGEKATADFKGAAGDSINKFAAMFGVDMSAVNDSLATANKSLKFVGQSLVGAAKGGNILTISMKLLKFALISTGIGAIVVGLGALIAYFTKSGEGADKFAVILAQIKSVLNNTIERLAVFGKGLWDLMTGKFKQGWEEMTSAFKGMGAEIKEDWKAAGDLAKAEDELEDKEIALIASLEARRAKVAELRRLAKEETDDNNKKLDLFKQAEKLIKSVYADEIAMEQTRLANLNKKLDILTKDRTDDQRREVAEQEAKISSLYRDQAVELRAILREKNTVLEATKKEFELFNSHKNIKMPAMLEPKYYENLQRSLTGLHHSFIEIKDSVGALWDIMGEVGVDATSAVNAAFESMAVGMGEFFGALMSGDAGMKDFGRMIAAAFADLAINVGKIAIGAGLAVLGVKKALMTLNPWVAIAAGVALVGIGTAVKGSLSTAGGGGGSVSASSSGGGLTYDSSAKGSNVTPQTVTINGELKVKGPDLVYVFSQENNRRKTAT